MLKPYIDPCAEAEDNSPCYQPCLHSDNVRSKYTQDAGTKGAIAAIIEAHLKLQEQFLSRLCEITPELKSLALVSGLSSCVPAFTDDGCEGVCGSSHRIYSLSECGKCAETEFDDEFYLAVIKAARLNKYPSRESLEPIANGFGWDLIYTPDAINLKVDDPQKAFAVLHLFPVPLGETIRIISSC